MIDTIAALTEDWRNKVKLMVGRAILSAINDGGGAQTVQVQLLDGEGIDDVERIQEYGFSSCPPAGSEGVFLSVGGNRDHGLIIATENRQFRVNGKKSGEMVIYDDLGQKVYLTRGGIVIEGAGLPVTIKDTPLVTITAGTKVRCETPILECTGRIIDHCDDSPQSLDEMRDIYNKHTHNENLVKGGPTEKPNEEM